MPNEKVFMVWTSGDHKAAAYATQTPAQAAIAHLFEGRPIGQRLAVLVASPRDRTIRKFILNLTCEEETQGPAYQEGELSKEVIDRLSLDQLTALQRQVGQQIARLRTGSPIEE